jgi:hypothetical protein
MLNLHATTKLSAEDVMNKAIGFFGPGGHGLEIKEQEDGYAYFQGGGGGVEMSIYAENNRTAVDMITREWEYQVKEFAREIK